MIYADEDGSKSALIDQVCAYLTTGNYQDSGDKNKKTDDLEESTTFYND